MSNSDDDMINTDKSIWRGKLHYQNVMLKQRFNEIQTIIENLEARMEKKMEARNEGIKREMEAINEEMKGKIE